jgi:hypothetical protein
MNVVAVIVIVDVFLVVRACIGIGRTARSPESYRWGIWPFNLVFDL